MTDLYHPSNRTDAKPDTVVANLPQFHGVASGRTGRSIHTPVSCADMRGLMRLCAAAGVLACATVAHAGPAEIYPLSKVQRGQTGYGMTTFSGTTPERFTFEVVSVVRNFLPKQDIV